MTTTINPRSSWQTSAQPVTGSGAVPNEWLWNTCHWPGATIGVSNPPATLRGMQSSYLANRGYSLGYNFAVFPDGSMWEIRGFDIRCAANGSQEVNRPGVAILLAVPNISTDPTEAMVDGVRNIVAATRERVRQSLTINSHSDVRPGGTECAGATIRHMIACGDFEPVPIPSPPDQGGLMYTMFDCLGDTYGGYMDANGIIAQVTWLSPSRKTACEKAGAQHIGELSPNDLANCDLLGPVPNNMPRDTFANVIG